MCELDLDVMWHQMEMFRKINEPRVEIKKSVTNNPEFFCPCGGLKQLAYPDNTPVCTSCGVADTHYIQDAAEWSSSVDETGKVNDASRCGSVARRLSRS